MSGRSFQAVRWGVGLLNAEIWMSEHLQKSYFKSYGMTVKRFNVWIIVVLATLLLGVLLVGGSLFLLSWWRNPAVTVTAVGLTPSSELKIGTVVEVSVRTLAPWYRWPLAGGEVDMPAGVQLLGGARRALVGLRAGRWVWESAVSVQPVDIGSFKGGHLTVQYTADRYGSAEPLRIEIPPFEVGSRLTPGELPRLVAAPPIDAPLDQQPRHWPYWLALSILLFLVGLVILSMLLRRGDDDGMPALTSWEIAEQEMAGLRRQMPIPPELFFVRLTDILRGYIERRFALPATEQTTPEFLHFLKTEKLLLSVDHRDKLADFLKAADMVKFARAEASAEQMLGALDMAAEFVSGTRPLPAGLSGGAGDVPAASVRGEGVGRV